MKDYIRKQHPAEEYKRSYPTMRTVRLSFKTLEAIKKRGTRYRQSINDILNEEILEKLEEYEKLKIQSTPKKKKDQVGKGRK